MSGLAGLFRLGGELENRRLTAEMARRLSARSRGAAGEGLSPRENVRLHQLGPGGPSELGNFSAAADGRIYNQAELTAALGLRPKASATEICLALFAKHGPEGLAHVNGDLALALYDAEKDRLFLFRDRFGIRPLYYAALGGGWAFASEVKALAAHPDFRPAPDPATLFDYLATHYRYVHRDPGRTFYQGVRQVPAGHFVALGGVTPEIRPYWRLAPDPEAAKLSEAEAQERLRELVSDSVARRLTPGLKPGFSVSSGMDSSSVASLAARITGRPLDLYSVSYGFSEYDEAAGIAPLAVKYASRWQNISLSEPDLLKEIARLVLLTDGPVCTVTWLSHHHLARRAAQDGQDLVFSGLGGDECLAGEYEHFLYFFADLKRLHLEHRLQEEVAAWIKLHDHPVFHKTPAVVQDVFRRLVNLDRPGLIHFDQKRYQNYLGFFEDDFVKAHDAPPPMPHPFDSYLTNRSFQDLFYETTPPSLRADEANVSAWGLESRFPFLDHRVVEFCFGLPGEIKYDRGVTKALMRRAMKGILPEANLTNTNKTGFNAPLGEWLKGRARGRRPGNPDLAFLRPPRLAQTGRGRRFADRSSGRPGQPHDDYLATHQR